MERVEELRSFIDGPESILAAREQELAVIKHAQGLLAENVSLSREVGAALDRLVGAAKQDIGAANGEALAARRLGSGVLIGMVLLSLVSSALIVWLYVGRNLITRLTALSDSMLAIAGGNLHAPLPPPSGHDEIARMAEALAVFRDTAVEVEDNNLREVAQARQRLIDAIESISEGFAFYDADDRLQLCNTRYKELLYGSTDMTSSPACRLRRSSGERSKGGSWSEPAMILRLTFSSVLPTTAIPDRRAAATKRRPLDPDLRTAGQRRWQRRRLFRHHHAQGPRAGARGSQPADRAEASRARNALEQARQVSLTAGLPVDLLRQAGGQHRQPAQEADRLLFRYQRLYRDHGPA